MLRLLKTILLLLIVSMGYAQTPRAISFTPQNFYYREKGRIEDSVLRTPNLGLWYVLYNNVDSSGSIWHDTRVGKFIGKWGTVTRYFASEDYVSTNFAPITGSGNYIQNQVSSPQSGSGIYTAGAIYALGRVGIGSASPSYKLGIRDTSTSVYTSTSIVNNRPAAIGVNMFNASMANGVGNWYVFSSQNSANNSQQIFMGSVTSTTGNTPVFVLGQSTGPNSYAERLRIDSAGNFGLGTTTPNSSVTVNGTYSHPTILTTNGGVTIGDHFYVKVTNTANTTITLPLATNIVGREYTIVKTSNNAFTVTIQGTSGMVAGASTYVLSTYPASVTVWTDGTDWWIK
ncbi:hypothetical protein [Chitinophaga pinensis]|uniref:Uncharacterized protein n=1 Tax=Chitinophaga pinensis (strain ATCC 43595 / DSM 2588 / LMG 13176 / NBRC 15968 / NCIMB 11800 / UQM 2034) TaxID=485918 RepID=A0A979GSE1_CHIPD|nr:hypothetical protein [Chitinophaga pinensis]ACU61368.1 hypothetical protein Cpin_3906 [Chitinophaga pinensis DSM 2588]